MREWFRKHRLLLALIAIPYIILMVVLTVRVEYVLTAPGGLSIVEKQITFADVDTTSEGSFHTVYVMSLRRPSVFQWLLSHIDDGIDSRAITPIERDEDPVDRWRSAQAQRSNAWNAAIILAASSAGLMDEDDWEIHLLVSRIFEYVEPEGVELLDRIVSVNARTDIRDAIDDALNEHACGTLHTFEALRNGDRVEYEIRSQMIDDACRFGIGVTDYYHILDTFDLEYEISQGFIGGPSGGFMQFLHIYNSLTSEDISRGLKIAGTGGVTPEGQITRMGGIKQKVIAAHFSGADVMFVPSGNFAEAEAAFANLRTEMALVEVSVFADAIDYLERWED